jgi:hypothetical protein
MDLRDTSIGDHEIPCFGRLPEIRHLLLGHTSDKEFVPPEDSESRGVISDRGVHAMCPVTGDPHVSKLEDLVLARTIITEKSVERLLKGLTGLKTLDVRGSAVTGDRVESLLGLRPTCKVIFDKSDS